MSDRVQAPPGTVWTPDNWTVPARHDPPPIGCTKWMLMAWLSKHYNLHFHSGTTVADIVRTVEGLYEPHIVVCTVPRSVTPAPWDVWNYMVRHSKRVAGGQAMLPIGDLDEH